MSFTIPNSSIWTSGIAALAPEDILRLVRISEPYVSAKVVQKPRHNDAPLYALGVSNLYELRKAVSAEAVVIHIHHDCTSLIQDQRRRERELNVRRNIERATLTAVVSSLFVTHWMRNQRFWGGESTSNSITSFLQDAFGHVSLLFASTAARSSSQTICGSTDEFQQRLSPAIIIAMEGTDESQNATGNVSLRNTSFCWVSSISSILKNKTVLVLTSTIVGSLTLWLRSRRDYVVLKVSSPDGGSSQTEHFLIRQDAVRLKQSFTKRLVNKLPLCIAAIASSMLIRRSLIVASK
ncbi:hypothetical protein Unana1_03168 [Umbelopsis nana]